MRFQIWIAVLPVALIVCGSALSRPELATAPDMTTKAVVDACGSDDAEMRANSCDELFSKLIPVAYRAAAGPNQDPSQAMCLPNPPEGTDTFRAKIIAWLRDHPDIQSLPFIGDGSRL